MIYFNTSQKHEKFSGFLIFQRVWKLSIGLKWVTNRELSQFGSKNIYRCWSIFFPYWIALKSFHALGNSTQFSSCFFVAYKTIQKLYQWPVAIQYSATCSTSTNSNWVVLAPVSLLLAYFWPMFPFLPPENARKPLKISYHWKSFEDHVIRTVGDPRWRNLITAIYCFLLWRKVLFLVKLKAFCMKLKTYKQE